MGEITRDWLDQDQPVSGRAKRAEHCFLGKRYPPAGNETKLRKERGMKNSAGGAPGLNRGGRCREGLGKSFFRKP